MADRFPLTRPEAANIIAHTTGAYDRHTYELQALARTYWKKFEDRDPEVGASDESEAVREFAGILNLPPFVYNEIAKTGFPVLDPARYDRKRQEFAKFLLNRV